jgi:hypothetical protein
MILHPVLEKECTKPAQEKLKLIKYTSTTICRGSKRNWECMSYLLARRMSDGVFLYQASHPFIQFL